MAAPFFSIIIPTLNEAKYIPKLLKALAEQTFRNFEVIIVDGSSEDKTVSICGKFKALLPELFSFVVTKRSPGYQRNFGAGRARGEYLVFLDADVGVSLTFLEELHLSALKQKFLFATTWIAPDSKKSVDKVLLMLGNIGQELAKSMGKQYSGGYNTIIKRETFHKLHGFREDLMINEDHEFATRAGKAGIDITILKEPQVIFSLRRWRAQGTIKVLRKLAEGEARHLLIGPVTSELFDYPMGGQAHIKKRRKKKLNLRKLQSYLDTIDKFEKKLTRLLLE
jgi:glycosyltransferase involved in cell wall biosynthesis